MEDDWFTDDEGTDWYDEKIRNVAMGSTFLKTFGAREGLKEKWRGIRAKIRSFLDGQRRVLDDDPEYYRAIKADFDDYVERLKVELTIIADQLLLEDVEAFQDLVDETFRNEMRKFDNDNGGGDPPIDPPYPFGSTSRKIPRTHR